MTQEQPPNEVCKICGDSTAYYFDVEEQEWTLSDTWWSTPWLGYVCSRRCYVEDHVGHGLRWDAEEKKWTTIQDAE